MMTVLTRCRWLATIAMIVVVGITIVTDTIAQKRSSSFGGSRSASRSYSAPLTMPPSSFGGTRSYSTARATPPTSFGRTRTAEPSPFGAAQRAAPAAPLPRAVGTPLATGENYYRSYGIPRRQEVRTIPTPEGQRNVIVHSYGGYSDGLLMGYLLGQTSWLWFTPFHPAFYYSQPYYVQRPDGTVEYFPPTFSLAKLIFVLIVIGAIVFIVWVIIRNRRAQQGLIGRPTLMRSSFGS